MRTKIRVEGSKCRGCEMLIQNTLEGFEGIQDSFVSMKEGAVYVDHADNLSEEKLKKIIKNMGYGVK
jgi:copper chaperone CopZ